MPMTLIQFVLKTNQENINTLASVLHQISLLLEDDLSVNDKKKMFFAFGVVLWNKISGNGYITPFTTAAVTLSVDL